MWIVFNKFFVPKNASAIALFPFVFIKHPSYKHNKQLMNHEAIHHRQQIEMLVVPFYIWYLLEFLWRFWQYKNWYTAYKNISFEREAFFYDSDFNYLNKRKFWGFWRFLF